MGEKIEFAEKPKEGEPWDVAIVGSGPAALTAAIYTTRGAASTLIIAGDQWGGQLMLTTRIDNFPGFPKGIDGPDLMQRMRDQIERFGAEIIDKNVNEIKVEEKPFKVIVNNKTYEANSVIVATGAEVKWLKVPGEDKFKGRGVSSCAPCDAPFFKDKNVMVVGGGDSAMEEALVLTKYAKKVTIVHRRDEFKASQAMQKRVEEKKIDVLWNTEVKEFKGDSKLQKVVLFDNKKNSTKEVDIDGVFVAIGHKPSTGIFKGKLNLDERGYIKKDYDDKSNGPKKARSKTNVEGIFVAGDVHDYVYRQAVTAAGFGCMAGMDVLDYLDKDAPSW